MVTVPAQAIEDAAQFLASGKSGAVLAGARYVLMNITSAVRTIVGKEVEVLKRTSKSTGTERLSFIMGKINVNSSGVRTVKEAKEAAGILDKGKEVFDHLTARGIDAEHLRLLTPEPGHVLNAVDVILNDKVLQYTPGKQTAAVLSGSNMAKGPTPT